MLSLEIVDFVAGTCKKMQVHSVLAVFLRLTDSQAQNYWFLRFI